MPRKRPGALRSRQPSRAPRDLPTRRIHGLSPRTSRAIEHVERLSDDYYLYPGATARALRRYRAFLGPPGRRPLYPRLSGCDCRGCSFDDVRHARDVLEEVLRQLPPRPRAELRRRVRVLDAAYAARTLPDPFAGRRQWHAHLWWRRRLEDGCEGG
ncbi:hypothetical protein [Streptomyces cinerochromogenes]|uniref:hypothetical protein n=1 Tax=Streptomyces cinerochromogenes TaxID=66422 RepID=UPI0019AF0713|nr:hypothetical protein [Streptomyces cinerochromogenes]GGS82049.1 hypothetical protein GCM10010206_50910 [Streptomyces cinerochromogenes]